MSRVSYEAQLQQAQQFIRERDHFLVVSHLNPDGDAISSTCTIGRILHSLGKNYTMANEESVPAKFRFLWGADRIEDVSASLSAPSSLFESIIAVDCADDSRMGDTRNWFGKHAELLNIDHHPTNSFFGSHHLIKEDAAATAQILYDLVETLDLKWDRELAESVYAGLLTDTGGFRYANTTSKVMNIASHLLEHGVNASGMANRLLETTTYAQVLLLQKALNTLTFAAERKLAWVVISEEDQLAVQASNGDSEGLVNVARNVEGVEVGILFKQVSRDEVKISFRSNGRVNVSTIASELGGGGHILAAGASVAGELDSIIATVIVRVEQAMKDEMG